MELIILESSLCYWPRGVFPRGLTTVCRRGMAPGPGGGGPAGDEAGVVPAPFRQVLSGGDTLHHTRDRRSRPDTTARDLVQIKGWGKASPEKLLFKWKPGREALSSPWWVRPGSWPGPRQSDPSQSPS